MSTLSHTDNFSHVAVGFADGSVLLLRHLDQSVQSALSASPTSLPLALPKPRLVHAANQEPVTGLHFLDSSSSSGSRLLVLSPSSILSYPRNGKESPKTLDSEEGADLGCSAVRGRSTLYVARTDSVALYSAGGKEATWPMEGPRLSAYATANHLLVVSPPFDPQAASSKSKTVKRRANNSDVARLTLIDVHLKLIAHSNAFKDGVKDIFAQWGKIWVLSHDGKVSRSSQQCSSFIQLTAIFHS